MRNLIGLYDNYIRPALVAIVFSYLAVLVAAALVLLITFAMVMS